MSYKTLHMAAFTLTVLGAINWGLIGLFNFNLVNVLLSGMPQIEQLVYIVVGISAVYILVMHPSDCKTCMMKGKRK